ncbi:hypothetical protein SAMN04488093_101374 [Tropicibacter naphthalenivorans]|uniref:Uncharacterized protein n=2 Tax=Tropicibacter naphthalenivorans TaxID=441103 RepID=A0A0P1G1H1_9RHOB|nr:hypothetical protein TRN7648_00505 [Tropicibacter naphthalenivorans]SMC43613.1 hypothetical protein SAMN04488093_101374 [Tropicibacter naphthalenivorans]
MSKPLKFIAAPLVLLGLAACEPMPEGAATGPRISNVPESVSSIAAPYQDLSRVRLRAEDGCYWYMHDGPVETTELPLRTAAGNPICTRPSS